MSMHEKIKSIYNQKYKNYKNIPLFPTIDQNIIINKPILEGFDNEIEQGANIINAYGNTLKDIFRSESYRSESDLELEIEDDNILEASNRLNDLATSQYKKLESSFNDFMDSGNNMDKDPAGVFEQVVSDITNLNILESPGIVTEIFLMIKNFFLFFVNFINNVLIYLTIIFIQIIYKEVPILPFGNVDKSPTMFNWPWKLDLNISPSDNIALDPSATLWNAKNGYYTGTDGTKMDPEVVIKRQKMLYDSNIVFSVFIQMILVTFAWVFTNNVYYYIYNEVNGLSSKIMPYRSIKPRNSNNDVININGGFTIIYYSIINTIVSAPYDFLYFVLFLIKSILQITRIYEFYALTYIILFLIILFFTLKYFWGIYTNFVNDMFMQKTIGDLFQSYFFYFLIGIYGLYQHFLAVNVVDDDNETLRGGYVIVGRILCFIIVMSVVFIASPFIRIFFYFWFLYICFTFQGFTNDVYDDIVKREKKQSCDSNKFSIIKTFRNAINYFFKFFYFFVILILIIFNFFYLNSSLKTHNSQSSSALKLLIGIIFLSIFMYLIYSIMNNNEPKRKQTVVYGDSFLNEKVDLNGIIDKMEMKNYSTPIQDSKEKEKEKDDDESFALKKKELSILNNTKQNLKNEPTTKTPDEIKNADNFVDKLKVKVKNMIKMLNPDDILPNNPNVVTEELYKQYRIHIQEFVNILKNIEEILDDPITKELFHTPFYLSTLNEKIRIRLEKDTSASINPKIKNYLNKTLILLDEIVKQNLDQNISNFINNISAISFPEIKSIEPKDTTLESKETTGGLFGFKSKQSSEPTSESNLSYFTKIKEVFMTEMDSIKVKIAEILNNVFPTEIITLISIAQLYNTNILKPFFIEAEPEIGITCLIITEIYPQDTKGSIIKMFSSVKNII